LGLLIDQQNLSKIEDKQKQPTDVEILMLVGILKAAVAVS
jgi:hypothetical protein